MNFSTDFIGKNLRKLYPLVLSARLTILARTTRRIYIDFENGQDFIDDQWRFYRLAQVSKF